MTLPRAKKKSTKSTANHATDFLREVEGLIIDTRTNIVQNGTKPVPQRHYYGSQVPKDISCYENGRYKNVELFSPVIYDMEHKGVPYSKLWETYENPNVKNKKVISISYPKKYLEFWYEERRRCLEGYTVGGVTLTGANYWYLNYWRIKSKDRGAGYVSPDFLDLDKEFFDLVEEARQKNKNVMFLKRRQIGFSEKVAALVAYEYTFMPVSESLIIAGLDDYAANTFGKTKAGLDSLSPNSADAGRPFFKRRYKEDENVFKSGYKVGGAQGVVKGYDSKVFSITTKDNPQAASGKSPTLAIMEEAGINSLLMRVYNMLIPSIEKQGLKNGRIIIFIGTGGEMSRGVGQMMQMFYNPKKYDLLEVENIWDENIPPGSTCACFFPSWKYFVMDYDGNSYKEQGLFLQREKRELIANDKAKLHDEKTQFPITPMEAFSVSGLSPFNIEKLDRQRKILQTTGWADDKQQWGNIEFIYAGEHKSDDKDNAPETAKHLFRDKGSNIIGVRWVPAPSQMIGATDADGDLKYPYLILEHPQRPKSNSFEVMFKDPIYDALYGAGTDPYDKPKAPTSDSSGSCSIYKSYLNPDSTANLFVARITWRPAKAEKFYESTLKLCLYYGMCQNLIEWSNVNIFDYYKNMGFEFLLKERPIITYATVKDSKVDNKYGIDPNTKYIWEEHYATYIEEYFFNMFDYDSVSRAMAYRKSTYKDKHNDDVTVSNMLALEHMLDNRHIGIEVESNEDEDDEFLGGFIYTQNGIQAIQSYGKDEMDYDEDPDHFYT